MKSWRKMTKVIGVTGPTAYQSQMYDAIENALGANFVLLAQQKREHLKGWLNAVDGVILSGGVDIHPYFYDQDIKTESGLTDFDFARDERELFITDFCITNNKPLLGICRGHQVIAVHHGIKLLMDITAAPVCHQPKRWNITLDASSPCHYVKVVSGTLYGEKEYPNGSHHPVNSFHHQAIIERDYGVDYGIVTELTAALGESLPAIIEGMMGADGKWLSVQWHPECDWRNNHISRRVFERFKGMIGK